MHRRKVILDTDLGTDVDDAFALAFLLNSPGIDLMAVTIVTDRLEVRAQTALRMLEAAGALEVPVALGAPVPLAYPERPFLWLGIEGKGVLERFQGNLPVAPGHAADRMAEIVRRHPGEVTLLPIGPLTNVALAIRTHPDFAENLGSILLMGGNGRFGPEPWNTDPVEHNIGCDPEAARIVFESGIPITMVGLDVTLQVRIHRNSLQAIRKRNALGELVAAQFEVYLAWVKRDWTYMHDPLAAALAVDPTLCRTLPMRVRVETEGGQSRGMTVCRACPEDRANARVCVSVDADRFEKTLLERIA